MNLWHVWHKTPLYLRIMGALVVGAILGSTLSESALGYIKIPSDLILRLLRALATPLVLVAVVRALMHAELKGGKVGKLIQLLITNTVVAIAIGLLVANTIQPGRHAQSEKKITKAAETDPTKVAIKDYLDKNNFKPAPKAPTDPFNQFLDNVPKSLFGPMTDQNNVIGVILIALAFGIALRPQKDKPIATLSDLVDSFFDALIKILHGIIDLVPFGVLGVVAHVIGREGFKPFVALGAFIFSVIFALILQGIYYLTRVRLESWVRPAHLIRGMRDAFVMAFSTASSTATMPVTYECLKEKVKVREESASMGALVGSNFNNDGTALYEAMCALFISQLVGQHLGFTAQVLVVLTSIIASVGAAGIPEAGLVTLTLVLTAVGLPTEYIPFIFTVDWFLDRCRTTINVMGDVSVACILDGKQPQHPLALNPREESV